MPNYDLKCVECGERLEVSVSWEEKPRECPKCKGNLKETYGSYGILWKEGKPT